LLIKEKQTKVTREHFIPTPWLLVKQYKICDAGDGMEKQELLHIAENVKWCNIVENVWAWWCVPVFPAPWETCLWGSQPEADSGQKMWDSIWKMTQGSREGWGCGSRVRALA
jgi:hypothetical protein